MSYLPKIIRTKRLILRPFKYSDFDDVFEYESSLEITKYMLFGPNTRDETNDFLNLVID
jgi:[ribosomal protein S5]-alanine N-acetyltransferase